MQVDCSVRGKGEEVADASRMIVMTVAQHKLFREGEIHTECGGVRQQYIVPACVEEDYAASGFDQH